MLDAREITLPPITPQAEYRIALGFRHEELMRREEEHDFYVTYIEGPEWGRTRTLALEYYGDACCFCNSTERLNVHHRTYERLERERLADLIVICRDCHAKHHDKAA